MKVQTRLGKNTLWVLSSRFGSQGLMVLFTVLIARRLGSSVFGEYAFIAATIFLGNILTSFGTDMLLIREIASHDDLSQLPEALLIQLALSGVFVAGVLILAPVLPNQSPAATLALRIYSLALFPLAFFTVFTTALRGKQKMDAYTILNLTISGLQVVLVWLLIEPGGNIVQLAWLLLITQVAAAVLAGVICSLAIPNFWGSWRFSIVTIPAVIRVSAPIALLGVLGIFYQKLAIYMLSFMKGAEVTGWFSAALRAVEASKIIHLAVFTALYPAMAQVQADTVSESQSTGVFKWSWRLLLATSLIVSTALFLFARPTVQLLYGNGYDPSIPGLRILIWSLIPYTINTYLSLAFLASGGERWVLRVMSVGLITLAVLEAILIPYWGLAGASLAVVIAETVQTAVYLYPRKDRYRRVFKLFGDV
ncbi:MAG: rane protein of unknown function [Chloroflexi bacterium]|nr:rane protein of unknown function [Chloroflexota bacterium]